MTHISVHTPVGAVTLFEEGGALVALDWGRAPGAAPSPLLREAATQLEAYFDRRLTAFDLPLAPADTPFRRRMRDAMCAIPYGTTASYGDLARALGASARAVGGACASNPLPILVPCHRVLAAGSRIGGYSGGGGPDTKRALLRLEGVAL